MATKLGSKRILAAILAAAAVAEVPAPAGDWMPLLPDQDFYDFQLFAPPDLGNYNIFKEDRDGIYFQYDRLYWGITVPRVNHTARTNVGFSIIPTSPVSPQTIVQLNNDYLEYAQEFPIVITSVSPGVPPAESVVTAEVPQGSPSVTYFEIGNEPTEFDLNTSWLRTKMTWGNRYEGGWSYNDRGVHLSYFQVGTQSQDYRSTAEFAASSPTQEVSVEFNTDDGGGGLTAAGGSIASVTIETTSESPPPDHLITQTITQQNDTQLQGAGVAFTARRALGRRQGQSDLTFSLGPRFIQLTERYKLTYDSFQNQFNVPVGGEPGLGPGGEVDNQVIGGGGQLGIITADFPSTLTGVGPGSLFQVGAWETYTSNNMVGPEFGLMLEGQQGRWSWGVGGKFTAGFNWQNNLYKGSNFAEATGADYLRSNFAGGGLTSVNVTQAGIGGASATVVDVPNSPLINQIFSTGQLNTTNAAEHRFVFSPIGEWRLGGRFKVSQAMSLNFGYTGMWLSQIARASSNTGFITELRPVQDVARNTTDATIFVNRAGRPQPGPGPGLIAVPPDGSYVETKLAAFNQLSPIDGANEYVFTNGVDLGLEIRY
ncbi:MAG: hypothetical protein FJ284_10185 [Planctomycetes bacterium]|nr:hypothetical protein [Planctomycetota bacterium]